MCEKEENEIILNLKAAGCSKKTIAAFLDAVQKGSGLPVLKSHRRSLLDTLHKYQKRIDCLDYLVYQIEKGKICFGNNAKSVEKL